MKAIPGLFLLLALTGCGLVTHGTSQWIQCETSPPGAQVSSANGASCSSPCVVNLQRKKDGVLTIERQGYETVTLPIRSVLSGASAGNVLLPGALVCFAVDVVSGAGYRLVPGHVDVTLEPKSAEPEERNVDNQ